MCAHLRNLKLADTFPRKAAPVDFLVGADQYYKLVPGSRTDESTTAMLTVTRIENPNDQLGT